MRHPSVCGRGKPRFVPWLRACFPLTALLLAALLGCVTTMPRPGATEIPTSPPTLPSPVATPAVIPSPTPEPTATATPMPTPTLTPEPTATPTPTPTLPPATPARTPSDTATPGGPILAVYAPEDGAVVPGDSVVVYGQTDPGARVLISGVEAEVDSEGGFRVDARLELGENLMEIAAVAGNGGRSQVSRRVTSLALPFLLLITEPESESVVDSPQLPLSGRTGPNAIVSINGRSVPVDRFGYFSTTMLLVQGPNIIDVVATNDDGETHSQVVAVIYRPASE